MHRPRVVVELQSSPEGCYVRARIADVDEPRTYVDPATGQAKPRKCWTPADGVPNPGDPEYYQGDIGTHGLHLMFQLDSDNARQQVPIDEIVSDQRIVLLPGQQGNVGERYGREFEKPLVVRVRGGGVAAGSVGG